MPDQPEVRIYDDLLIGVADAADPLYEQLKEHEVIGPHHLSPAEWLPGAKSVVSYFLPYSAVIRVPNRVPGMPAPEWIIGRFDGEVFNEHLRSELARWLGELGGEAVVPAHTTGYKVVARRSNWSERHTAFIAGLGTFGLSKSMITARGSAGRFGSAITTLALEPTPRNYEGVYDRCPWLANGTCGACIARCPAGAIRPEGKDIPTCAKYLDEVVKAVWAPRYGCGKCQTGVPCEIGIPSLNNTPILHHGAS
jgi:epoxyqueuosine reductase QueG